MPRGREVVEGERPEIGIGPLNESEGGLRSHVLGIIAHSAYPVVPIRYSRLSPFWPGYHGVGYTVFSGKIRGLPDPYADVVAHVRLRRFRLLHTHGHPYWLSLFRAIDRERIPRIHSVHQIYEADEARSPREATMRDEQNRRLKDTCARARAVVTVSRALRDRVLESFGADSVVIPNGIDVAACGRGDGTRFTSAFGIRPGFILYVGSALGVKRPELMCAIARHVPDRSFVAIGPGLTETRLAEVAGRAPRNVRPLGPQPRGVVLDAMSGSATVLLTSRREGVSTVAMEGLACGRPVVAPRGSGFEELLLPVDEGLLFDAGSLEEARASLEHATSSPETGARGLAHVRAHYDWSRVAPMIDRLYAETLAT